MDYKYVNDYELVYLTRDGDEYYFDILYNKYKPVIEKICISYLETNAFLDKDDLFTEGFLGLNHAIRHFDINKNTTFYTYVVLCIKSKLNDYLRKLYTNKRYILNNSISIYEKINDVTSLEDVLAFGDITYLGVINDEYYRTLINFKNGLSIVQGQVFELKTNGFKIFEIAELLSISKSSVSYYLKCIRDKYVNLQKAL